MNSEEKKNKWYHEIWFVVLMLFVMGPFGFPLLWKSQKCSTGLKWVLTILFTVLTVGALWGTAEVVRLIVKRVQELQASLQF